MSELPPLPPPPLRDLTATLVEWASVVCRLGAAVQWVDAAGGSEPDMNTVSLVWRESPDGSEIRIQFACWHFYVPPAEGSHARGECRFTGTERAPDGVRLKFQPVGAGRSNLVRVDEEFESGHLANTS